MTEPLRLMAILAHPDDETLGMGGALAKYAEEGVEAYLLTATRGQRGWFGDPDANPGPDELGRIREGELRAAAETLGVREVTLLDYVDGELDDADTTVVTAQVTEHVRRIRPHVVITFGHDGHYGHPDHIAICQIATASVIAAADAGYLPSLGPAHCVSKLYYLAPSRENIATYQEAFGELVMDIDGVERRSPGWAPWTISTRIDARPHWRRVWDAVRRHTTQLPGYDRLTKLPEEHHVRMWGTQEYYRVFSLVNGTRAPEDDLFAGLRGPAATTSGEERRAGTT
jgi:LmbE family N-acetylglucosaminyl deacetylase